MTTVAALPDTLPELPMDGHNIQSHEVTTAHGIISRAYQASRQLLRQEGGDALRLRQHAERINTLIPLLQAFEKNGLLRSWAISCAHLISRIKVALESAVIGAEE